MKGNATIIAVAGKGGVGKTSLSATIVRCLVEKYPDKKILAIDADPAVGLSTALGIDVKLTIYEALGNTYTVEYQGTTYTQKKGFYTGNYEFPVSNYTHEDVAVDGSKISYTESKEGATKVNLAEITKRNTRSKRRGNRIFISK